jgi:hypothetical protein
MEHIKKGGTVENAEAYQLDDLTTPVKLVAHDSLFDDALGSITYNLKPAIGSTGTGSGSDPTGGGTVSNPALFGVAPGHTAQRMRGAVASFAAALKPTFKQMGACASERCVIRLTSGFRIHRVAPLKAFIQADARAKQPCGGAARSAVAALVRSDHAWRTLQQALVARHSASYQRLARQVGLNAGKAQTAAGHYRDVCVSGAQPAA